ncbi:hypothetical protein FOZ62_015293, partial [Perkinsus olseni]
KEVSQATRENHRLLGEERKHNPRYVEAVTTIVIPNTKHCRIINTRMPSPSGRDTLMLNCCHPEAVPRGYWRGPDHMYTIEVGLKAGPVSLLPPALKTCVTVQWA